MATVAPMARVPFAPLDSSRLQQLASVKNRQNAILSPVDGKAAAPTSIFSSLGKRSFDAVIFNDGEGFDGENVDPEDCASPSKKTKSEVKRAMPFTFTCAPASKASMAPPSTSRLPSSFRARLSTPLRTTTSSAPSTAPAGRSPIKRKSAALNLGTKRRSSAPFTRIDPPFATSGASSTLPFSLDAALNDTLSKPTAPTTSMVRESFPKSWFFDIHQDTPDEEAGNLMEHSTSTLDLSDDDERVRRARSERGKENVAPESYDAVAASRPTQDLSASELNIAAAAQLAPSSSLSPATSMLQDATTRCQRLAAKKKSVEIKLVRKRKLSADAMDDGERAPLSELELVPLVTSLDKTDADTVSAAAAVDADAASAEPARPKTRVKLEAEAEVAVWEDVQ